MLKEYDMVVDWIPLAQNRDRFYSSVKMVIKLRVPQKANVLSS
jgi:hypothetical protein